MDQPVRKSVRASDTHSPSDVPPTRTQRPALRKDLGLNGITKGRNKGDCGARTLVPGECPDGPIKNSAMNACMRLARLPTVAAWLKEGGSDMRSLFEGQRRGPAFFQIDRLPESLFK